MNWTKGRRNPTLENFCASGEVASETKLHHTHLEQFFAKEISKNKDIDFESIIRQGRRELGYVRVYPVSAYNVLGSSRGTVHGDFKINVIVPHWFRGT